MAARAAVRGVVRAVARSVVGEIGNTFATLAIVGAYPAPVFGVAYSQNLTVTGGSGIYSDERVIGVIPDGMSLSLVGDVLTLSGTPASSGPFDFNVSVFDATNGWRAFSPQSFTVIVPTTSERVQNGDFEAGGDFWTAPVGEWSISHGSASGTGASPLVNELSTPVESLADISAFRFDLSNPDGQEVSVYLFNSTDEVSWAIYNGFDDGTEIPPTNAAAGATGPYDQLLIFNADGTAIITVDNITLIC